MYRGVLSVYCVVVFCCISSRCVDCVLFVPVYRCRWESACLSGCSTQVDEMLTLHQAYSTDEGMSFNQCEHV